MKKPNFFIIGAPKCGTTSLWRWLSEHPNIYMAPNKEPCFFSVDVRYWGHPITKEQYELLFQDANEIHKAVGEASTHYLFSRVAIPQIECEYPNSKYIVIIRNPVDMAYSLHKQWLREGYEDIIDFRKAWYASFTRKTGRTVSLSYIRPKWFGYQKFCCLGEQLDRLLRIVPYERVLILLLDDIKENPRREYLKVLEFLQVPDDGRKEFPIYNKGISLRFIRLRRILSWLGLISNFIKRKIGIPIEFRTKLLAPIYRVTICKNNNYSIDPSFRKELINYFKPDIERLSKLINRDLSHWLK